MNVFEKYSIEEISKKTKISSISLKYIKNKEFNKLPRVKFIGFIKIIENEFKVDLSDLIKEYEEATKNIEKNNNEKTSKKPQKNDGFLIILFAISLVIAGGYYLYKTVNLYKNTDQSKNISIDKNHSIIQEVEKNLSIIENNKTEENKAVVVKEIEKNISKNDTIKEKNITENNLTIKSNIATQIHSIKIIPKEKVWFRVINLDNNKTAEYLTASPKEFNGSNWYIKFGHGFITIQYGDEIINLRMKKVVRVLFKNGKYKFLEKPNRYEK